MNSQDITKFTPHPKPVELIIKVHLDKAQLDRTVKIKATLLEERHEKLINFLRENVKVFA